MLRSLLLLIFVATGSTTKAGPDDLTKWLMNEPASMMDIGLLRFQKFLDEQDRLEDTFVGYEWDTDRFLVHRMETAQSLPNEDSARAKCEDWFHRVRRTFHVDPDTGELLFNTWQFAEFFSTYGYARGPQKKQSFNMEIGKKIHLFAAFRFGEEESFRVLECRKPLLSTGFSVEVYEG